MFSTVSIRLGLVVAFIVFAVYAAGTLSSVSSSSLGAGPERVTLINDAPAGTPVSER